MRLFPAVVLVVGAAACGLPYLSYLADVPPAEYADGAWTAALGRLLLFSPYVALAVLGRNTKVWAGLVALALLLVGTTVFFVVASTGAQSGAVIIYIGPAQWVVAICAGDDRLRRSGDGTEAEGAAVR